MILKSRNCGRVATYLRSHGRLNNLPQYRHGTGGLREANELDGDVRDELVGLSSSRSDGLLGSVVVVEIDTSPRGSEAASSERSNKLRTVWEGHSLQVRRSRSRSVTYCGDTFCDVSSATSFT